MFCPYLYFMPVCFAVDSFKEMWCWGVKVPKLRAIIATVRNFARAALTEFGVVVFCLLISLSSPFRFLRLCSVHAMETCISEDSPSFCFYRRERTSLGSETRTLWWAEGSGLPVQLKGSWSCVPTWVTWVWCRTAAEVNKILPGIQAGRQSTELAKEKWKKSRQCASLNFPLYNFPLPALSQSPPLAQLFSETHTYTFMVNSKAAASTLS